MKVARSEYVTLKSLIFAKQKATLKNKNSKLDICPIRFCNLKNYRFFNPINFPFLSYTLRTLLLGIIELLISLAVQFIFESERAL